MFLTTERLTLRPLEESDVKGPYSQWLNDPEITKFNSHGRYPITTADLINYVKNANKATSIVLAIEETKTGEHIGNISLQKIRLIDRNAEIAFLLGNKSYWGKGIMMEAALPLIKHAFTTLNLHRIHCGTSMQNVGMQKLASKLGFNKEGQRSEAIYTDGKYHDIIEYGLINKNN